MSRAPAPGEETWAHRNQNEPGRNWRDEERPKPVEEPACSVCGEDCIPLNDAGECAECEPKEDETCAEWIDRTKARRAK